MGNNATNVLLNCNQVRNLKKVSRKDVFFGMFGNGTVFCLVHLTKKTAFLKKRQFLYAKNPDLDYSGSFPQV